LVFDRRRDAIDNLDKALGLGRRYPGQMQALAADAGKIKQLLCEPNLFFRLNITFQVMAVPEVSAGHENAVNSLP
jgi:hypothetical protein